MVPAIAGQYDFTDPKISIEKRQLFASTRTRKAQDPILASLCHFEGPSTERITFAIDRRRFDLPDTNPDMHFWISGEAAVFGHSRRRPLPRARFRDLDADLNASNLQST
jgi:hypothetical protein